MGAERTLGVPGEGGTPKCAVRRGSVYGRTNIKGIAAQTRIKRKQIKRRENRKHTRRYPASGLAWCDNTPTVAYLLCLYLWIWIFVLQGVLPQEVSMECSGSLRKEEWGEMRKRGSIVCPRGTTAPYIGGGTLGYIQTGVHGSPRKP